jgi:hypothetical protein
MFKQLLLIPLLLMLSFISFALDDQGNPNDPTTNDRANACYEDGTMADKCDTEWEWICGWYMIRFDYGIFSREEIPASCTVLLPGLPEAQQDDIAYAYPTAGCIELLSSLVYVDFNGGNFMAPGSISYSDSSCTSNLGTTSNPFVYAPNGAGDALDLCIANGFSAANPFPPAYNPGFYNCI